MNILQMEYAHYKCKLLLLLLLLHGLPSYYFEHILHSVIYIIIYKEMFLGCDWLIRVQLIPNITQNSAKSVTQCKNL